jgi:hypothetical protein
MRNQHRFCGVTLTCTLALLSCSMALPVASCGPLIPLIHEVATVVADITGALDAVEAQVKARQDDADPALVTKVVETLAKARKALTVVQAAARTAESVSNKDYLAAVDDLLTTYDALTEAARAFNVMQAPVAKRSRLGAAAPGTVLVPTSRELRDGLMAGADVAVREVLPRFAIQDAVDRGGAEQKLFSNIRPRHAKRAQRPYRENLGINELRSRVQGTRQSGVPVSVLLHHVCDVRTVASDEEVRGVATGAVVAPVENARSTAIGVRHIADGAMHDGPRDPVCAVVCGPDADLSVPSASEAGEPRPAIVGSTLFDLRPEPCNRLLVHGTHPPVGHGPGRLHAAGPLQAKHARSAGQPLCELRAELLRETGR